MRIFIFIPMTWAVLNKFLKNGQNQCKLTKNKDKIYCN